MTDRKFSKFEESTRHLPAEQRAEALGIDLSITRENLLLSPAERLRQNDLLLNEVEVLEAALRASHAQP
jgi:hypothetical protein